MNKRIISLLLVIVMALSLVACGAPAATEAPAADNVPMQYIKHDEAKELLNSEEYVFFDIRKAADSSANSIPGAEAWDMDAAKEGDAEAGKATMTEATKGLDKKIIVVCYSGKRYAQAATNALSAIGYDMSKVCAPSFEAAMRKYGVDYQMIVGEGMFHCYPVFPIVKEAREGWEMMVRLMREAMPDE